MRKALSLPKNADERAQISSLRSPKDLETTAIDSIRIREDKESVEKNARAIGDPPETRADASREPQVHLTSRQLSIKTFKKRIDRIVLIGYNVHAFIVRPKIWHSGSRSARLEGRGRGRGIQSLSSPHPPITKEKIE